MNENNTKINWFPGHMAKSLKQMTDEITKVDMLIYVLDSRAPFSCINPKFEALKVNKPVLYVLNKTDLADDEKTEQYKKKLNQKINSKCVSLNSTLNGANKIIEPIMKTLCFEKLEKYKSKGIKINLRAMVVGVPNCGKSTLINNLSGQKKTITGDKAGITRGKQWVSLKNGFEILDTPGTLWPNLENQNVAKNLAAIGSIKNEVFQINEIALYLIDFIRKNYLGFLEKKYSIETKSLSDIEILECIARHKHFLLKGNEIDFDRTCFSIVDDFRKGKLGKITLDV